MEKEYRVWLYGMEEPLFLKWPGTNRDDVMSQVQAWLGAAEWQEANPATSNERVSFRTSMISRVSVL